jgi:hypothetical protein
VPIRNQDETRRLLAALAGMQQGLRDTLELIAG